MAISTAYIDWSSDRQWVADLISEFSGGNAATLTRNTITRSLTDPTDATFTPAVYPILAVPYDSQRAVVLQGDYRSRRPEATGEWDRLLAIAALDPNGDPLAVEVLVEDTVTISSTNQQGGLSDETWEIVTILDGPDPSGFSLAWIVGVTKLMGGVD